MNSFVFCAMRFMLAFSTIFIQDFLWLQLFVYLYSTLYVACFFIHVKQMNGKFYNNIEIFNEVATLISVYFLLCFSDWILDIELRNDIGDVYAKYLIGIALINFLLILHEMTLPIQKMIKYRILKKAKIAKRKFMEIEQWRNRLVERKAELKQEAEHESKLNAVKVEIKSKGQKLQNTKISPAHQEIIEQGNLHALA